MAVAVTAAKELCHHPLDIRPFGNGMTVPPMRAGNLIVPPQGGAHPHCDGLLADIGVHHTRDVTGMKFRHCPLVEVTDHRHVTIHVQ